MSNATPQPPPPPARAADRSEPFAARRILILSRGYAPTGSATNEHLADLARALVARGHAVRVLCSSAAGELRPPTRRESDQGVQVERLWTPGWGRQARWGTLIDNLIFYPLLVLRCLQLRRQCDVLIALDFPLPMAWLGRVLRALTTGHVRYVCWPADLLPDKDLLQRRSWPRRAVARGLRWLNDAGFRGADVNVVLGRCMGALLEAKGVAPRRLHPIRTWSRGDEVLPLPPAAARLRRARGLADAYVVMYAGTAMPWHAFDAIEQAITRLQDHPRIRFVFASGGAEAARLRAWAQRRGYAHVAFWERVHRDEVGDLLASADVHLVSHNPRYQGTCVPSKLYGVMAAARPVIYIGPPACQTALDIRASRCGYVLDTVDADGLVALLLHLAAQPEEGQRLGARGRAVFLERFDRPIACGHWIHLLEQLTDGQSSSYWHQSPAQVEPQMNADER